MLLQPSKLLAVLFLLLSLARADASLNAWNSNGPFGGAISRVFWDSSVSGRVYAATSERLYRSDDGGIRWKRLEALSSDYEQILFLQNDPASPGAILVVAQSVSKIDLFRSTDGGASWEKLPFRNPASSFRIQAFRVDPEDPQLFLAVTAVNIYRSTDRGQSWSVRYHGQLPVGPRDRDFDTSDLALDPQNHNRILAHLFRRAVFSNDGGATWKNAQGNLNLNQIFHAFLIHPHKPNTWFAAGAAGIFMTTDSGAHWIQKCECRIRRGLWADPDSDGTFYAGGYYPQQFLFPGEQVRSTDGGESWNVIAFPPLPSSQFRDMAPDTHSNITLASSTLGILRSTNNGITWQASSLGIRELDIQKVASSTGGLYFAVSTPYSFYTTDAGLNWHPIGPLLKYTVRDIAVSSADPNIIVAEGNFPDKQLAVSTDRGKSWTFHSLPFHIGDFFPILVVPHPTEPATILATDPNPFGAFSVYKSTNLGSTWNLTSEVKAGASRRASALAVDSSGRTYVGTNFNHRFYGSRLYFSSDGKSWQYRAPMRGGVNNLLVDQAYPNAVYAQSFHYYIGSFLYKSTDHGEHWSFLKFIEGYVNRIALDPLDHDSLFADSFDSLYFSKNGGDDWFLFSTNGLPPLRDFQFDRADPTTLLMGTAEGVYQFTRN